MTLEVYSGEGQDTLINRRVDVLEGEYLDSWKFEKPGDYRVVLNIADSEDSSEVLHYEVRASVGSPQDVGHEKHGFLEHHFGSKWGWWGGGLMLLMMIPMMILL